MQTKAEVMKELDRMFGPGPNTHKMYIELLLDIRDGIENLRCRLEV